MAADFNRDDDKIIPIGQEPQDSPEADDYLSRLSNSLLAKDRMTRTSGIVPIPPISANQSQVAVRKLRTADLEQPPKPAPPPVIAPKQHPVAANGWLRRVDFYDNAGKFITGTILVFEDGSMGVYKEADPARDYDVVLMLQPGGSVARHGLPLYNYTVEPVGRLTGNCLDMIMNQERWERDSIIFHLLKFRDRVYIPGEGYHVPPAPPAASAPAPPPTAVAAPAAPPIPPAPAPPVHKEPAAREDLPLEKQLRRGRHFTIQFDKSRAWNAVYWGKDDMGFVVAHNTDAGWALMHLDLEKFRKSLTLGSQATEDELRAMEKDITHR